MQANRPLIKIWSFVAFFLPLTTLLGFWQLDRAEEKQSLQQSYRLSQQAPLVRLESLSGLTSFTRVTLDGHYLAPNLLLENRTRDGKVGYELLSVFALVSGQHILVNRGWTIAPPLRANLPHLKTPEGRVRLTGYLYFNKSLQDASPEYFTDAVRVQALDWEWIDEQFGTALPEFWQVRLLDESAPGAEKLGWPDQHYSPQKHYGYAVQWFGLAIALSILALCASRKIRKQDGTSSDRN